MCLEEAASQLIDNGQSPAELSKIIKSYRNEQARPGAITEQLNEIAEKSGKLTDRTDPKFADRRFRLGFEPIPAGIRARTLDRLSRIAFSEIGLTERIVTDIFSEEGATNPEKVSKEISEYIKELERDFERRGSRVTAGEKYYLEVLKRANKSLAIERSWPESMKAEIKRLGGLAHEDAGATVGIAIIVTAVMGWYLQYKNPQMEGIPPLPNTL